MDTQSLHAINASFRDRSGFVFTHQGQYYRTVHQVYQADYDKLMKSGLYESLVAKKLFIPHKEVHDFTTKENVYRIIKPQQLSLISYAAEWSFSMLQDAALCTLSNALEALKHDMILKDANTFNIQFVEGKPLLIDSLSFESYVEGEPWIAYKQFCECFLAPLLLMKYTHASLHTLFVAYPNGIPIPIVVSLLPFKAKLNLHVYLHIFMQAGYQQAQKKIKKVAHQFSRQKLTHLLQGLFDFVTGLKLTKDKTVWDDYYEGTILSKQYLDDKKVKVKSLLDKISFHTLLDLGANEGEFSLMFKNTDKQIIALDEDRNCIEKLYIKCRHEGIKNIQVLIANLTTPTPALGWNHTERTALFSRIQADVTLSLALIHHLAIANNIPLSGIFEFLLPISEYHIIEFVGKNDPKVQQLLEHRKDIFDEYTITHFKQLAQEKFVLLEEVPFPDMDRCLFLLKRK